MKHRWQAAGIFVVVTLVLATTATNGFVRDEGYYFKAAAQYHDWFELLWENAWQGNLVNSFTDSTIRQYFSYNHEHPDLIKILMGFTEQIFSVWLGWTSPAVGYRLAAIFMVALGCSFLFLFGAQLLSEGIGLLAVALFLVCPHVFYHSHLACFDGPITAMAVITTYAFWRAAESRPWVWWCGIVFGLALATKHNSWLFPLIFFLAWLVANRRSLKWARGGRLVLPAIPYAFFTMLILGPLIFYFWYPYGWHAPWERIGDYIYYHLHHEHYPVDYFGTLYVAPPFPWSFPWVMTGITTPLMILIFGLLGCAYWIWKYPWAGEIERQRNLGRWLVVFGCLLPPALISLPTVPIFGGTKHWMPMMPFFCLLAAYGIWQALMQLQELFTRWPRNWILAGGVLIVLALPLADTWRTHPFGHTYFNDIIGGHQGGAGLGMMRTFWGGDGRSLLPILNDTAPKRAMIYTHRMNFDSFRAYQQNSLLRSDLRWTSQCEEADFALVNWQREYLTEQVKIWKINQDQRPLATITFDDVPIVSLYRLRTGKPE